MEKESELVKLLVSGTGPWQTHWSHQWLELCKLAYRQDLENLTWRILVGDALYVTLPGKFDYIWQDPFSPDKNPSMWSPVWFAKLLTHAHAETELLTYSVSRTVKDALDAGGWQYERLETPTSKRHWLKARPKP